MKRYLLFAGHVHEAGGGTADYLGTFETLEDAQAFEHGAEWAEVAHIEDDGALRSVSEWECGLSEIKTERWSRGGFVVIIREAGWKAPA